MRVKNILLGLVSIVFITSINHTIHASSSNLTIDTIDFSKPLTQQEQDALKKYYQEDSKKIFNKEFANKLYQKDKQEISASLLNRSGGDEVFTKEKNHFDTRNAPSVLGTYGDILVTYSFSSFGINVAATGHAAIVSVNENKTVESMPAWFDQSKKDGVFYYPNNWGMRPKVYGVRVRNASSADYNAAARYAMAQADARKLYNLNFFDKGTTERFYCSQLVWRAWKNQGYEVDRMNLGDWEPVSPAELVGGGQTYVFYYKD